MNSLHNILAFLGKYQLASGQNVCRHKSKIYYRGALSRCRTITNLLGMEVSTFPNRYLGVQIMPGAVNYRHISNLIDKIKNQLVVWKGKMLSFQDRIVLINSVIDSYSIHNMAVYKWPIKFIRQVERVIRITSLAVTNRALLMKLWWNIRSSNKKWARFLWSKYTSRLGRLKHYGVKSSILPGIRLIHSTVDKNTKVLLGDGRNTSLYFDIWYGNESIADMLGETERDVAGDHVQHLVQHLVQAGVDLNNFPTLQGWTDCRVWMPEMNGKFSVSSAKQIIKNSLFKLHPNYDFVLSYKAAKGHSRIIKDLWLLANMVIRSELWQTRNMACFHNAAVNFHFFKQRTFHLIHDYSVRLKSFMHNTSSDLEILTCFGVRHRQVKLVQPIKCNWSPPNRDELLLCCDGAAKGNPGRAGAGVVVRDADCNFMGAMSIGLGRTNNFLAELYGIIVGLEWAVK
ncbi:uncharacterized protein LOC113295569 [Papaver somniferum]|uniref:uncharacterized protein LOC113295569 n=1 Tax=Papaver somniferum TaxID=3469 RepID=UPI000E703C0E|nr:uncharacterized protein LOC113295569 [Papaver somniferum]